MKNKILIGIVILLIVFSVFETFHDHEEEANGKPTVKIGVSLPLTGMAADSGQSAQDAINMANKQIKQKDTKFNYELIIEDNRFEGRVISMNVNKLMNMDKVNAIVSFWGNIARVFSEANNNSDNPVPHVAACAWGTQSTAGEYNFNNDTSIERNANLLVSKLQKENIKNIGLIFQNGKPEIEMQEVIVDKLTEANINITFNEIFNYGEKDFRTFLAKIKRMDTDIIYLQLLQQDFMAMYKQMQELKIDLPLTTILYFDEYENKDPVEGYWFVNNNVYTDVFLKDWKKYNGDSIIKACSPNTYDSLNILVDAFENAEAKSGGIPTSEEVLQYMKNMKTWQGAVGEVTFEKDGLINSDPKLAIIKDGKTTLLEE